MSNFPTEYERQSILNDDLIPYIDLVNREFLRGDTKAQKIFEREMYGVIRSYLSRLEVLSGHGNGTRDEPESMRIYMAYLKRYKVLNQKLTTCKTGDWVGISGDEECKTKAR